MNDGFSRPYVRTVFLSLVFLVSIASPAVASQGGVNEEASIEDTGVESVSHPDFASAGEIFEVSVRLNEESASNVTSVRWVTQVCVNSGICYPPETHSMTDEDDAWDGSIVPEETVTYVNWKIEIEWEDGNTTSIPENGFGWRVWSDCWYDNGTWGGASTECQSDDSSFTPGFATHLAIASMSLATLMIRRE
jgi:hypothetical protein|tara:strand:- start:190 stop:765 length:576 start_codon:yes stop_codon:yes gene_type:complete